MIYTQVTPNPATLKFVTDQVFVKKNVYDYISADEASDSPLASLLFKLDFVTGVFIGREFVSVTKKEGVNWEEAIPLVKNNLKSFFESGVPAVNVLEEESTGESESEDDETVMKIKQLLEENIRPAVAMDGGDISFESFENGVVRLKLKGACSGCPSSTMTLKMGIEGLLTRMVPGVESVEAIS